MAAQPWATPKMVRDYTEDTAVKARSDAKLKFDVSRAEAYIIAYTHNDFKDAAKYPKIPPPVRQATILLAEFYAVTAGRAGAGRFKSESFDEYSYTLADTDTGFADLALDSLLDAYILDTDGGDRTVFLRLRRL